VRLDDARPILVEDSERHRDHASSPLVHRAAHAMQELLVIDRARPIRVERAKEKGRLALAQLERRLSARLGKLALLDRARVVVVTDSELSADPRHPARAAPLELAPQRAEDLVERALDGGGCERRRGSCAGAAAARRGARAVAAKRDARCERVDMVVRRREPGAFAQARKLGSDTDRLIGLDARAGAVVAKLELATTTQSSSQ
jgi:hypothetical protein